VEKRTSERRPVIKDVMIGYHNLGLVLGKTVDISLGGMCINTGAFSIPVGAAVRINFCIDRVSDRKDCEAHAIVVRHENSRCCLMFDGMDEKTHQALRSLVGDWQILNRSTATNQLVAS